VWQRKDSTSNSGGKSSSSSSHNNITVVCHSTSRISSLLKACHQEDQLLSALVTRGEVDGVLCLQTDVEELLHSKTIKAAIEAGLPIVAVGLASAQQIIQMGGRVISCYDLSLAPLASSSASLSPFLSPPNTAAQSLLQGKSCCGRSRGVIFRNRTDNIF
jgi:hypothetical protein